MERKINMTNAFILNDIKKVLLIHNIKNGQDRWEMPGGKTKESDNSFEDTTIREVEEELGIRINIIERNNNKIFGDYETVSKEGAFFCRTHHAKIKSGEPRIMEKEKSDGFDFFDYNGLLKSKKRCATTHQSVWFVTCARF